jgi:hypothetical protein
MIAELLLARCTMPRRSWLVRLQTGQIHAVCERRLLPIKGRVRQPKSKQAKPDCGKALPKLIAS